MSMDGRKTDAVMAKVMRHAQLLAGTGYDVAKLLVLRKLCHAAGDRDVLDNVADTLIRAVRPTDLPIRWSGSEFLLVLPGLAVGSAKIVAERIRAAMHARGTDRVAIAGGVAQLAQHEQFGDVIARAREQLSVAHDLGHNRISSSPVH